MDKMIGLFAMLMLSGGALLLTGCGGDDASLPPTERVESIAEPGAEEPGEVPPAVDQLEAPAD